MTDIDLIKQALDALEYWDVHGRLHQPTEEAITALKERLAQEEALQALHDENKRLGLYEDAYAEPPQKKVWTFWNLSCGDVADAIKAKIKEKNGG